MEKFKTLSELNKHIASHGNEYTKDTVFEVEKDNLKYMYEPEDRVLIPLSAATNKGLNGGVDMSLVDMNAQLISQLKPLPEEELNQKSMAIDIWAKGNIWSDGYYMLLCNEVHYYTVFLKPHEDEETHFNTLGDAVIRCADVVGTIHSIDILDDEVEVWIKNRKTNDINCYHLFDYTGGIATYGGE